jgi:hypothetical protein
VPSPERVDQATAQPTGLEPFLNLTHKGEITMAKRISHIGKKGHKAKKVKGHKKGSKKHTMVKA